MASISLSWSNLKTVLTGNTLSSLQYVNINSIYYIFAYNGLIEFSCIIIQDNGSDQTDFENNYKANCNQTIKTNVVQQLGADSVIMCPFGTMFSATANQTTTYDLLISNPIYIKGGVMYASPGNMGDTVTVQIIDKDNVTGAGANTVLATYVDNWYVIPQDMNAIEDVSLSAQMPAGLYVRCTYKNSSPSTDSKIIMNLLAYQGTI